MMEHRAPGDTIEMMVVAYFNVNTRHDTQDDKKNENE